MTVALEELEHSPALPLLYAKATLGALPGMGGGDELPDRELGLPEVRLDAAHVAAYDRVCGFRLADELPPTYLHVYAFPLAMKLMTARSFPLPPVGLVHVANRIEQSRPLRLSDQPSLRVGARDLRRTDRGVEVDLVAEAQVGGTPLWSSTSTYLRRGGGTESARTDGSSEPRATTTERSETSSERPAGATWRLPADLGRRYAAVSGDINPIHLHSLSARPFGFRRAIAHGMWTKARCLAALEGRLPESMTVEVEFRKPLLLPATVSFASSDRNGGRTLELRDARSGAPHLTGRVAAA